MTIGQLIKERRLQLGITQEELANKTEISIRTIQRIENDEVDPRAYTLQVIAKALDFDFSEFAKIESEDENDIQTDTERKWLALIHLSGLLPLFFPTIIIWNRKKSDIKGITNHYRAVIAFQSTIFFVCLVGLWVFYWTKNPRVIIIILLLSGFLSIRNTLKVLNGKPYKYFGLFGKKKN